jgi:hypothetical protein
MQYWILKAQPANYDFQDELWVGREEYWDNVPASAGLAVDDRLFFWASSPARWIAGLGVVTEVVGKKPLRVRCLTAQLDQMPGIELLKTVPKLKKATFLQAGRYGTAFPLTSEEARETYRIVVEQNPTIKIWSDWPGKPHIPDIEAQAIEGRPQLVSHLRKERNPKLAKAKKSKFRQEHGDLFCEACLGKHKEYGTLTGDLFEVHHRSALSNATKLVVTTLKDLAVVCPNCHRAIHRSDPMLSVEALGKRLMKASRK